jgi:hypothetical protein
MGYIGTAGIVKKSSRMSEDICGEMQKNIASWFPHVMVRNTHGDRAVE